MPRAHDDNWDLASSVGATATMAATGRAMATKDPRGLINDPFAEPLVRAVGVEFFAKMLDGEVDLEAIDTGSPVRLQSVIDLLAVRTKYYDDYLLAATAGGVRQVVVLASGLDSRAYRLAWPAGAVIYEIDQPAVIDFKTTTLAGIGAEPAATWHTIPIDLRHDWPGALRAAGLDTTAPTAWLAEGLLVYLPPDAQDRLLDNVTALSAPGSTFAAEFMPGIKDFDASRVRELSTSLGGDNAELDLTSLVYSGERNHVMDYLGARGWDVAGVPQAELLARNGLEAPTPKPGDPLSEVVFFSGGLTG